MKPYNVNAYLCSHPLDEDNDCFEIESIDFLPGFKKNCEDEPLFDEHNVALYDKIENICTEEFNKAASLLGKLISQMDSPIKSVSICIDYADLLMFSESSHASFVYDDNEAVEGHYNFFCHQPLVIEYLKHYYEGYELTWLAKHVWVHEIIHMLDQNQIKKNLKYECKKTLYGILEYNLIRFREEGIANLFELLSRQNGLKKMAEAKDKFRLSYRKARRILMVHHGKENLIKEIFDKYAPYEIGPWLVLEYLVEREDKVTSKFAELAKNIIESEESNIDLNFKLEIIKRALTISVEDWLIWVKNFYRKMYNS